MLLWLARLSNWISALNVFQYTTFRAVMAALTALAFSLLLGPWTIRKLTALKVGQAVRSDGPQTHLVKNGTPTMGGSLILTAITLSTLLWANLANPYIWILLIVLLATGALGFYDDWRKVVYKDPNGVSARFKMVWQSTVALGAGFALFFLAKNDANNILIVPFFKQVALPLGVVGFIVLTYLTIVGTSNAVNLTDGLDGLAAFPVVLVAQKLSFSIIQYFDTDDEKFDLQAQSFSRDDTQALQQFIDGSAKAVGDMTSQAVKHINQGVSQLKDKLDSAKPEQPNGDEPQDKEK